ncbi:MAG: hypothetical protein L3J62_03220 [Gammaproteobacteria bacterium]|nr:hypothetical protein [Gammaproteobacteria bacterium]MCF6229798.1 hypothetical protein [Gammaproteobacteria bacterium]
MLIKQQATAIIYLLALLFAGGALVYASDSTTVRDAESVLIIGSTEHPDPILERVQDLEEKGVLRDVMVLESFPVQIWVTGPKNVIEKLQKMPKRPSSSFK